MTPSPATSWKTEAAELITDASRQPLSDEDQGKSQQPLQSFTQTIFSEDLAPEMSFIFLHFTANYFTPGPH